MITPDRLSDSMPHVVQYRLWHYFPRVVQSGQVYDRVYIKRHYIGQRADNEGDFRIIITEFFYQGGLFCLPGAV